MAGNNGRSLYISPSCHTLSKAWLMSMNAAVQYLWFSSASVIALVTWWTCSIVACFCRKPNL